MNAYVDLFTGAGGAIAVLTVGWILMLTGQLFPKSHVEALKEQMEEKDVAVKLANDRAEAERRRADVAVDAAQTSNILLASITGGRSHREAKTP